MNDWIPAIGLEIHAQLSTESKLFCSCSTRFGAEPNRQVCPYCLGHPGTLPVLNRRAVELAIRFASAVGSEVQPVSRFARKNYFYPDLPKNYQITQHEEPLCLGGAVRFPMEDGWKTIEFERIHLEEDAGKSRHRLGQAEGCTLIDLNRCGVALIEIVTKPEIVSPAAARAVLFQIRHLLVWLEVSDGNMEEGSLRCDANVSLRPKGSRSLGTRTELKNLNSFRFLEHALGFEIERQRRTLARGEPVVRETRLWDERTGRSRTMRSKEEIEDYRYFPEPDLPPLSVEAGQVARLADRLPELPEPRCARLIEEYSLSKGVARRLTQSRQIADMFEQLLDRDIPPRLAASWVANRLPGVLQQSGHRIEDEVISVDSLASVLGEVASGAIGTAQAEEILDAGVRERRDPRELMREGSYTLVSDRAALLGWIDHCFATYPEQLAKFRGGKEVLVRFFIGKVMEVSGGRANPGKLADLIRERSREGGR